jgi:hypothetical protein
MSKVKIQFRDGSSAYVDESMVSKAKEFGGVVIGDGQSDGGKIIARFKDGSRAMIDASLKDKAIESGAEILEDVKKKGQDAGKVSVQPAVQQPPIVPESELEAPSTSKEEINPYAAAVRGFARIFPGAAKSISEALKKEDKQKSGEISAPSILNQITDDWGYNYNRQEETKSEPVFSREDYKKRPTLSYGVFYNEPETVNISGFKTPVAPEYLPQGYMQDSFGVKKFISDFETAYNSAPDKETKEQVYNNYYTTISASAQKYDPSSRRATVSDDDLSLISTLIGGEAYKDAKTLNTLIERAETLKQIKGFGGEGAIRGLGWEEGDKWRSVLDYMGEDVGASEVLMDKYDYAIDKLSKSLQKIVKKETAAPVMEADMRSFLKKNATSSLGDNIADAQSRLHTEKLGDAFWTGLAAGELSDKGEADQVRRRAEEGKTLSSNIVAKYTAAGTDIIKRELMNQLIAGEITPEQHMKSLSDVEKEAEDNFINRKDIAVRHLARAIGEWHAGAKRSGAAKFMNTVFGEYNINDKEVDEVPDSYLLEEWGIDMRNPKWQEYKEFIKKNEGVLPFDNVIQKDGLARGLWRGATQPVAGIVKTVEAAALSDDEERLKGEQEEITSYVSTLTDYANNRYGYLYDSFNGLGQFAMQYLLMEAGVGAFKSIGQAAGGVPKIMPKGMNIAPAGAEGAVLKAGSKFGNFVVDHSMLMGQLAPMYLQSYGQYHQEALKKTDNGLAATLYAATNATMESVAEKMFDNVEFGRKLIKAFRGTREFTPQALAKMMKNGLTKESAAEFKQLIGNKMKDAMSAVYVGGKNVVKEAAEELPVAFTNFVTDAVINPQSINDRTLFGDMKDSFTAGLVSFSIPAIFGAGVNVRNVFRDKTTQADALMMAARNKSMVLDALYNLAEDGKISNDELNGRVKMLNTAENVLQTMPHFYADGDLMGDEDRVKYMAEAVQERYYTEAAKNLDKNDPERVILEANIAATMAKRREILESEITGEDDALFIDILKRGREADISGLGNVLGRAGAKVVDGKLTLSAAVKKGALKIIGEEAEKDPDAFIKKYGIELYNKVADRFLIPGEVNAGLSAPFAPEQKAAFGTRGGEMREGVASEPAKTVQEKLMQLANKGMLAGGYSELLQERPDMVDDVLLDYAKQKFGVSDDGKDLKFGGREIDSEVNALVARVYPTKESVVSAITGTKISEDKADELPDNGITVGEMLDRRGSYKGMSGQFYVDEGEVVFKEDGKPKMYVLGNLNEVSGRDINDFGITHEESVVSVDESGALNVRGRKYVNKYSDPLMAITQTKEGISVTLNTEDGKSRTFKGGVAEDIAYQIHLQQIQKNNEQQQFEEFVNSDTEAIQTVQDGGYSEIAKEDAAQADAAVQREAISPATEEIRVDISAEESETAAEMAKAEEDAEAQRSEIERKRLKPDVSLDFVDDVSLVTKDVTAALKQDEVKKQFDELLKLIECCYA